MVNRADRGFDSKEFRGTCEQEAIIANIPHNPRNELEHVTLPQYPPYFFH